MPDETAAATNVGREKRGGIYIYIYKMERISQKRFLPFLHVLPLFILYLLFGEINFGC